LKKQQRVIEENMRRRVLREFVGKIRDCGWESGVEMMII